MNIFKGKKYEHLFCIVYCSIFSVELVIRSLGNPILFILCNFRF